MYQSEAWMNIRSLKKQGLSYREIGRRLGMDRRTVARLCAVDSAPKRKSRVLPSKLDPYKETTDVWLEAYPTLAATVIMERLRPLGYTGGYTTVKDYVRRRKDVIARKATVRFETLPGYQAQVDFGAVRVAYLGGSVLERFFILQMGFSRYRIVSLCDDETRASLVACLASAFAELGGVPTELLLDNMAPVVRRPRQASSEAVFQEGWITFCAHYGLTPRACAPYRAQTKGKVERLIGVVKAEIAGRTFLDRDHLAAEIAAAAERYNTHVHSTTKMAPAERLKLERGYLSGLPATTYPLEPPALRRVSSDSLVCYAGNRYSVPARAVGRKVKVQTAGGELIIYDRSGALLTSHLARPAGAGETVMVPEHYEGVPGSKEAFAHLERLQRVGLSPFVVEKRSLSVYEELTRGSA